MVLRGIGRALTHAVNQSVSLYQTNRIACCLSAVYISQAYRDLLWSFILVDSVRQTLFGTGSHTNVFEQHFNITFTHFYSRLPKF